MFIFVTPRDSWIVSFQQERTTIFYSFLTNATHLVGLEIAFIWKSACVITLSRICYHHAQLSWAISNQKLSYLGEMCYQKNNKSRLRLLSIAILYSTQFFITLELCGLSWSMNEFFSFERRFVCNKFLRSFEREKSLNLQVVTFDTGTKFITSFQSPLQKLPISE